MQPPPVLGSRGLGRVLTIESGEQLSSNSLERQHYTRSSIETQHLRLSAGLEQAFVAFTTTDTTSFQLVSTLPVTIWATLAELVVLPMTQVRHSNVVGGAAFQVEFDLTNTAYGGSVALTFSRLQDMALAFSNEWQSLNGIHSIDLAQNSISPGKYDVEFWVKNLTAGTLSLGGTTAATRYISALAYGREPL